MKTICCNIRTTFSLFFTQAALIFFVTYSLTSAAYSADDLLTKNTEKKTKRIHITADRLIGSYGNNYAKFTGNVEATYGDFVIKSDSLKIYYKRNPDNKEKPNVSEESIDKIIAGGNVKIWADDKVATTQKAVYTIDKNVVVLTGENSTVTSGKNTISGSKITISRDNGHVKVEGGSENRVKAVFYSTKESSSKADVDSLNLDSTKEK